MTTKYAIIIPDGCADFALDELGGRTPLAAAATPNMDRIAKDGVVGRANFVPEELPAGSDVANLGVLGYDTRDCYSGRAPLEAAAQGIELGPRDWAVRCNMVTIENGRMRSFAGGHISTEESAELLKALQEKVDAARFEFRPSVGYRNLLICRGSEDAPVDLAKETYVTPPHDLSDQSIADGAPRGPGCQWLHAMMVESAAVFRDHPVNKKRIAEGKLPATNVWLWGMGMKPSLAAFESLHGRQGAMITGVDLLRGIGRLIGWDVIDVPGATGYTDTDFAAKGRYAVEALEKYDVVCVHVEAPDEAGHDGAAKIKVDSLESIDRDIVGPVHEALKRHGDYRILVTPDHPTPVRLKTHTHDAVPWTIAGTGVAADALSTYDEPTSEQSQCVYPHGFELMDFFLGKK